MFKEQVEKNVRPRAQRDAIEQIAKLLLQVRQVFMGSP
jgi:hypothetical protein